MRNTLAELAGLLPVAIISGRDRADVERLVGLPEGELRPRAALGGSTAYSLSPRAMPSLSTTA